MELDELQKIWGAERQRLHARLAINEQTLRAVMVERAQPRVSWSIGRRIFGLMVDVALIASLLSFTVGHADEPRFVACALLLIVFLGIVAVHGVEQILALLRLDLTGPVARSQRTLGRVAMAEYRVAKWIVLTAVLLWVPILAVLVRATIGVDLFAITSVAWALANIVGGGAVVVVGQWLSRRYVERPDLSPRAQRLVDFASGGPLRRTRAFVERLARFESSVGGGESL